MDNILFAKTRKKLNKTQKQLSQLLGGSLKAVQSFEQGWRKVPVHVERQLYFLLARLNAENGDTNPCWETMACNEQSRSQCPAWELNSGNMCWFINGTLCQGKPQENWDEKMMACRKCKVFKDRIPKL
jgi:DNA-binding XRE family transcriptional regulator